MASETTACCLSPCSAQNRSSSALSASSIRCVIAAMQAWLPAPAIKCNLRGGRLFDRPRSLSLAAALLESLGSPLVVTGDVEIAEPGPGQVRVRVRPPNTTFLCEDFDAVLQAVALVELAREGWVESAPVSERCWPVVAHQLLALTMQTRSAAPAVVPLLAPDRQAGCDVLEPLHREEIRGHRHDDVVGCDERGSRRHERRRVQLAGATSGDPPRSAQGVANEAVRAPFPCELGRRVHEQIEPDWRFPQEIQEIPEAVDEGPCRVGDDEEIDVAQRIRLAAGERAEDPRRHHRVTREEPRQPALQPVPYCVRSWLRAHASTVAAARTAARACVAEKASDGTTPGRASG